MAEMENNQQDRAKGDSGAVARKEDLEPTYTDKAGNVHKKRILTGDRTTGKLHLGHYIGSLKNRVELQHVYDTFILMADIQALTTHWEDPKILKQSVMDVALDYMAIGLVPYTGGDDDGSRAKIVVQSRVPAIADLTVLYGLVTPMSVVLDNPTTKSEAQQYGMGEENESELVRKTKMFQTSDPEGKKNHDRSVDLMCVVQDEFPEVGTLTASKVFDAVNVLLETDDVSMKQDLVIHSENEDQFTPFFNKIHLRRALRDLLVGLKRKAGIRQMTYGFLGYPVSQAADITFVNAHLVPVGEDQVPHIELTREIVKRMNKQYGKRSRILTVPQALIGGGTIKGLDGNAKMSKSLGNAVYLSDSDQDIWSKVKKAVTDPQRIRKDDPGRPEICNIFTYHKYFNEDTEPAIAAANLNVPTCDETAELCRTAGIGCVECKKNLAAKLTAMFEPVRQRRADWEKRPDDLIDVLKAGTRRGNEEGNKTLERVQSAMHLDYWK